MVAFKDTVPHHRHEQLQQTSECTARCSTVIHTQLCSPADVHFVLKCLENIVTNRPRPDRICDKAFWSAASVILMTTTLHTSCLDQGFSTSYREYDRACLYRIVLFKLETVGVPVDILCLCSLVKVKLL